MLSNLLQLTVQYFNYPTEIKLWVNIENENDNYPKITLNVVAQHYDYGNAYKNWNDFLTLSSDRFEKIHPDIETDFEIPACYERYMEIYPKKFEYGYFANIIDWLIFYLEECYNLGAKDLLDERLMTKINDIYKFKFIIEDKIFELNEINNKTRGFRFQMNDDFVNSIDVFTITLDTSKLTRTKSENILQIHFEIDKKLNNFRPILLHSQPIPHLKEMSIDYKISYNCSLLVTKTKRLHLEPPYSQCSHYRSDTKRPFNALSHMQCYRHCLRSFAQNNNQLNCTPFLIDDMITELDFFTEKNIYCKTEKRVLFNKLVFKEDVLKKCYNKCPNDCLTVDYSYVAQRRDSEMNYLLETSNRSEVSIVWDSRQPMLSYIEESVLSFTDYLVNCGGLLGLWFGTNANDLFIKLIELKIISKLWLHFKILISQLF